MKKQQANFSVTFEKELQHSHVRNSQQNSSVAHYHL
jgi:hypothetical protein